MTQEKQPSTEELNEIFAAACANHQHGQLELARRDYERLLRMFPGAPMLQYNLGLVYFEQENFDKAVEAFAKGVESSPEDVDLLFNMALAKKKLGDIEGAIAGYGQVLQYEPESVDALYNLAGCYKDTRDYLKGIEIYLQVLALDPVHSSANNNIAYLYQVTGKDELAITHYEKVLTSNPGHEAAQHMLAALKGEAASSAPNGYVAEVFDNYSDRYEQSLVNELEYRVPEKLRRVVDEKGLGNTPFQRGLDLGCGTGLGGESFKDLVKVFDGVDLSLKMIEQAGEKSVYSTLDAGSIDDYLQNTENQYDFFLAADVFAYLGELKETFQLLFKRASEDALLCFSTETYDRESFILRQTGRFAHGNQYITGLAQETGWRLLHCKAEKLRKEKDRWIEGELWFLQRQ